MPLINSNAAVYALRGFRTLWINGRFGGGKTSLAFLLAHELLRMGVVRHVLSNVRSVWNDNPADVAFVDGKIDVAVVMDEGGSFLKTGKDVDDFLKYMRKMNVCLILPSWDAPAPKLQKLQVQREMTLEAVGLPLWVYQYTLKYGAQSEKQRFYWLRPREIFGIYDTDGTPNEDEAVYLDSDGKAHDGGSLNEWFARWTEQKKEIEGYGGVGRVRASVSDVGEEWRVAEAFQESAQAIADAVSVLNVPRQKRGR